MNHYMNEDVMWQRLQDLQREADNRRLFTQNALPRLLGLASLLGRRAWWLGGLAMRRAPRRRPLRLVTADRDVESDAA